MIGVGFTMVWKTDFYYNLIGYIDFAERYFSGGSRVFYKLVGVIMIFIGALVVANLQNSFIEGTLGRLLL
jgi:hypothetical protein